MSHATWGLVENDGKTKMKNHFGKRIFYLLGIIMGILLSLSSAKADEWSRNYQVGATIDLTHPRLVPVWKDMSFEGTLPGGRPAGHLGFVCDSESDTSFGACPTKLTHWVDGGANVTLRFTNLKTKATVDLTVTGEWRAPRCVYSLPFSNGFTGFTGVVSACPWGTVFFEARLPETELRKLPYGGVWDAQMRLKTMEWAVDTPIGDVVTDIRLNVRSEASISIPNPTVKLPVTMTGHSEPVTVD
ncbi:CfaE/CblD family pilus tip adhesin, partial [Yersinia enterocolitica]